MGVLYSLLAAFSYAGLVIVHRHIHMASLPFTFLQLLLSGLFLLPYTILQNTGVSSIDVVRFLPWILTIGILHTGIAYLLYFTSIAKLPPSKIALFSYLDPCTAILLSILVLHEQATLLQGIGILCILAGILLSRKEREEYVL